MKFLGEGSFSLYFAASLQRPENLHRISPFLRISLEVAVFMKDLAACCGTYAGLFGCSAMRCSCSSTVPIDIREAKEPFRLLGPDREDIENEEARDDDVEEEEVDERRGLKASSHEPTCFLDHIGKE